MQNSFVFSCGVSNPYILGGDYRHGFNGMENVEEITDTKSHLDFGARIYDARVGRWLSRDPHALEQPTWSPYKAMNDNPIIYTDPDGKDEILRITVVGADGTSVTLQMRVNSSVMTDFVLHDGAVRKEYYYYDYMTSYTIYVDENGVVTPFYSGTELIKANGVKDADWGSPYRVPPHKKDNGEYTTPGGLYLVSESGEAKKISKISGSLKPIQIDLLVAAMGGMSKGGFKDFASAMSDIITVDRNFEADPQEPENGTGNGTGKNAVSTTVPEYYQQSTERQDGDQWYRDTYLVPIDKENYTEEGSILINTEPIIKN